MRQQQITLDSRKERYTIPTVPNFLKVEGRWVPLRDLNAAQLTKIGRKWTEALIRRASEQRVAGVEPMRDYEMEMR